MNKPPPTGHPLIQTYLADLERALSAADPRERADVLEGVREHLREILGDVTSPDGIRVREALGELGPVESIAAQATSISAHQDPLSDPTSLVTLIAAIAAAILVFIPFISIPLAVAALVASAVHLRTFNAHRGRCWAGIWVAASVIIIVGVSALLFLPASNGATITTPTDVASEELSPGAN